MSENTRRAKGKRKISQKKKGLFVKLTPFLFALWLMVFFVAVGVVYAAVITKNLPSPEQFSFRQISQSTKLYDRTGRVLLYEIHGEEKRTIIPLEEIPDYLKQATLATEDDNFYTRPAFDWRAILRAFFVNLKAGRIVQGGSTITQQLARNIFLTPRKTFDRKIKELILAIELESKYSKNQILYFYLNQIPYGSNAYGVEAASQTYFNKSARDLTLAEAALLAGLPKAPSFYSPWGLHSKELFERQSYVLNRMVDLRYITLEEKNAAKKEKIDFAPQSLGTIKAPHFSLAVKDYLVNRYGEGIVNNGGLKITTTLDWEMQEMAEKAVKEGAERNEELYKGRNASLVAQDPKTGQILALVGSRDYFNTELEGNFNVATQGLRQPGSALKPFAYLTAFKKGYSPETIIFDVPTEFDTTGNPEKSYQPQNFDERFRGPVAFEEGLAQSINVPSVKTLYLAGLDDTLKTIHDFGITTLKERWRYGLSLILGGGEVKLIDLVNAYATLAQKGVRHEQAMILKVEDPEGNVLETYQDKTTRVMDEQYTGLINQILSDKQLRSPLFQNSLSLTVFENREVALKTGTTNDYRDAWSMGYTPSLAVGVWAGNNNNKPMERHGGSILAAVPIWNAFLREALNKYEPETFTRPDPVPLTNKPMLDGRSVAFPTVNGKTYPQIHSILYYLDKKNPLGPKPINPAEDPQFYNWESAVLSWARYNVPNFYEYNLPVPNFNESSSQLNDPVISGFYPTNGEFITIPSSVKAEISSAKQLKKVELYFNQKLINSANIAGNHFSYQYSLNEKLGPQNLIEIRAENAEGQQSSLKIIVFR